MSGKKKFLALLLFLVIAASSAVGVVWHLRHYCVIDLKFYPRDAEILDLREESISIAHYDKLRQQLPDCRIFWNVPFQNGAYPHNIRELEISTLTEGDIPVLDYFEELETVNAKSCRDYGQLQRLQQAYPDLRVSYVVPVSGKEYAPNADVVYADGITGEEIGWLQYLPNLKELCISGGEDPEQLKELAQLCQQRNLELSILLGGEKQDLDASELTLTGSGEGELNLLHLLPNLTKVHFSEPEASAQSLLQLRSSLSRAQITWEKTILGVTLTDDMTAVDLSEAISPESTRVFQQAKNASVQGDRDEELYLFAYDSDYPLPDKTASTAELIALAEEAMAYCPKAERLMMCGSVLDNEAMAAFRENHRQDYKVIWNVHCGGMVARTDTPYFMPTKYHVYYFQDYESENLKYCEDMVCVDLGHMAIKHIEWAAYMPNLEYLVLAHTDVRTIEPIRNCKKLKFLEVDWSAVSDFEPLLDCTELEDLNVGNTYGNFDVLAEMTWLNNLWMVGCSRAPAYRLSQSMTDTTVMLTGAATVANGWRNLDNYYAMRDIMGMFYMKW